MKSIDTGAATLLTQACSNHDRSEPDQFRFQLQKGESLPASVGLPVMAGIVPLLGVTAGAGFFFTLNRSSISEYCGNKNKLLYYKAGSMSSVTRDPSEGRGLYTRRLRVNCLAGNRYGQHEFAKGRERERQRAILRCRESGRTGNDRQVRDLSPYQGDRSACSQGPKSLGYCMLYPDTLSGTGSVPVLGWVPVQYQAPIKYQYSNRP